MLYTKLSQNLKIIAIKKLSFVGFAPNVFKQLRCLFLSEPKNYETVIFHHYVEF